MSLALLVMRHGKSDWDADYGADIDRPLAPRGRRAAATMGRFLAASGELPDLAVTSPARRAHDTLGLVSEAAGWNGPVEVRRRLYGHGPMATIEELRTVDGSARSVLVVGHEPTWSELVMLLTGARARVPTAAVARIELDIASWPELEPGCGTLQWLVPPRTLERSGD